MSDYSQTSTFKKKKKKESAKFDGDGLDSKEFWFIL